MDDAYPGRGILIKATSVPGLRVSCCSCGHTRVLDEHALDIWLGEPPTMRNIRRTLPRLICSACRTRQVDVWSGVQGGDQLLADAERQDCPECGLPRLLPELRARPQARICATCMPAVRAQEEQAEEVRTRHPMPPPGYEACKRCGKPSILRENGETGTYFLSCTTFPRCMWSRDMPNGRSPAGHDGAMVKSSIKRL